MVWKGTAWMAALLIAVLISSPASGQDFLGAQLQGQFDYLTTVVGANMLDQTEDAGANQASQIDARQARQDIATLAFQPSVQRRQENFAAFVETTRATDPATADELQQILSQGIIGIMGRQLAPMGFDMNNLADAYAFWWLNSWDTAQGVVRTSFPLAQVAAVKRQVATAMAGLPQLRQASDADKQQLAEVYWVQAAMIGTAAEGHKNDPVVMQQLAASVRRGAAEAGLDFNAMELTAQGFVSK